MNSDMFAAARGVSRQGLDADFAADEAHKSNLILEARAAREQGRDEAAAARFAEAGAIEERLTDQCLAQGLVEKSYVHGFSAASCWAQAGDFHHAIVLCDGLLARPDLPEGRLRQRIQEYADALRARRAQWYAVLLAETATVEA
uniref:Uncharacterized protein n=1 Tax=uncultured Armatimonadetes bacterium TaxID=157466 RepID=A0A6J4HAS2_9BACT|nr:hypothetical protein AVDCRST_MAG63-427 [uncultured Armatimonadetes bacterium]